MVKYHISKSGKPSVCRAKNSCPLGGGNDSGEVFESKKEATNYADKLKLYKEIEENIEQEQKLKKELNDLEKEKREKEKGLLKITRNISEKEKEIKEKKEYVSNLTNKVTQVNTNFDKSDIYRNHYYPLGQTSYHMESLKTERDYHLSAYMDIADKKIEKNNNISAEEINKEFNQVDKIMVENSYNVEKNYDEKEHKQKLKKALEDNGYSSKEYAKVINRYSKANREIAEEKKRIEELTKSKNKDKEEVVKIQASTLSERTKISTIEKELSQLKNRNNEINDSLLENHKDYLNKHKNISTSNLSITKERQSKENLEKMEKIKETIIENKKNKNYVNKDVFVRDDSGNFSKVVAVERIETEHPYAVTSNGKKVRMYGYFSDNYTDTFFIKDGGRTNLK